MKNLRVLSLLFSVGIAFGAPVILQRDFGSQGVVRSSIGNQSTSSAAQLDSADRVVVVGDSDSSMMVARYTKEGALDTTFNTVGYRITALGESSFLRDCAVLSDNSIIAVGFMLTGSDEVKILLAKYTATGALDTSFGDGNSGITQYSLGQGADAYGVAVQSDGKIIVAGNVVVNSLNAGFVGRFKTDGSVDTAFGSDGTGFVTIQEGTGSLLTSVAVNTDNSVAAGGWHLNPATHWLIARLDSAGNLTSSFGNNGIVASSVGTSSQIDSLQFDGTTLVVAGAIDEALGCARYKLSDGQLDTSFGDEGLLTAQFGLRSGVSAVQIDDSQRLVCAGFSDDSLLLARYSSNGTLDTTFAEAGSYLQNIGTFTTATSALLTSDSIRSFGSSDSQVSGVSLFVSNTPAITIVEPSTSAISDDQVTISGISSESDAEVRISIAGVQVATAATDALGNWSMLSPKLVNGSSVEIKADLYINDTLSATNTASFDISAPNTIAITFPTGNSGIFGSAIVLAGQATQPSSSVEVTLDGVVLTPDATTDGAGLWTKNLPTLSSGSHTVQAKLKDGGAEPTHQATFYVATTDTISDNYLFYADSTTQSISVANAWRDVSYNTEIERNGWTHPTRTEFECVQNGTYLVEYRLQGERDTSSGSQPVTQFVARGIYDGSVVAGSNASIDLRRKGQTLQLSHKFIVNAQAGKRIKVQFSAGTTKIRLIANPYSQNPDLSGLSASVSIIRIK